MTSFMETSSEMPKNNEKNKKEKEIHLMLMIHWLGENSLNG